MDRTRDRLPFALLMLLSGAGCLKQNGTGRVEGSFLVRQCQAGTDRPKSAYGWEAGGLSTQRYMDTLEILLQAYSVRLEQSDGLLIRLPSVSALRANSTRPLITPVSLDHADVNISLSLFTTCPDNPSLYAVQGTLQFDKFTIAEDPANAGDHESLAGTLTATVVGDDAITRVGWVKASFDFLPQPAPLTGSRQ